MHVGPSNSLEIRERLWQWHLKPLKFIPKNPQTDPSNIKTFIGGKERWFQKRKRKKRDRKEGLLDLLEKEKQKTRALQTWKAFDVPILFLFFFYKLLLFFFLKKKKSVTWLIPSNFQRSFHKCYQLHLSRRLPVIDI